MPFPISSRAILTLLLWLTCAAAAPPLVAAAETHAAAHIIHPHVHQPSPVRPAPTAPPSLSATPSPLLVAVPIGLVALAIGWTIGTLRRRIPAAAARHLRDELARQTGLGQHLEQRVAELTRELAHAESGRADSDGQLARYRAKAKEKAKARKQSGKQQLAPEQLNELSNHEAQLRAIADASLSSKRLLSQEERLVFSAALRAIQTWNRTGPGPRLSLGLQISLGEFLETHYHTNRDPAHSDSLAFRAINCKRVDFLIYASSDFLPVLVIEHQGKGHYQGNWEQRDAIKRAAFSRAGVALLETKSQKDILPPCRSTLEYTELLRSTITTALSTAVGNTLPAPSGAATP